MLEARLADSNRGQWKFIARPGGWVIAERADSDGSIRRERLMAIEAGGKLSVSVGGRLWRGELRTGKERGAGAHRADDSVLIAQFPGKIRKVLVAKGQAVAAGDPLVLVEAMKMEFAVQAPYAGVVSEVRVREGQQISPGDRFVSLDEKHSESPVGSKDGA